MVNKIRLYSISICLIPFAFGTNHLMQNHQFLTTLGNYSERYIEREENEIANIQSIILKIDASIIHNQALAENAKRHGEKEQANYYQKLIDADKKILTICNGLIDIRYKATTLHKDLLFTCTQRPTNNL